MALQTSGPISFQDIATEFGLVLPQSMSQLATAANIGGLPKSLTDFYGLSAFADIDWSALNDVAVAPEALTNSIGVAYTPDGRYIMLGSSQGQVQIFDLGVGNEFNFSQLVAGNETNEPRLYNNSNGGVLISPDGTTVIYANAVNLNLYTRTLSTPFDHTTQGAETTYTYIGDSYNTNNGTIAQEIPSDAGSYALDWGDDGNILTYFSRGVNSTFQASVVTINTPSPYTIPTNPTPSDFKFFRPPVEANSSLNLNTGWRWSRTGEKAYYGNAFGDNEVTELRFSTPWDVTSFTSFIKLTNFDNADPDTSGADLNLHAGAFVQSNISNEVWSVNFARGITRYVN